MKDLKWLFVLMFVFLTTTVAKTQELYLTGDKVNVRKGPGKQYSVMLSNGYKIQLDKGFVVNYEGKTRNGFKYVSFNRYGETIYGWVSAQFLRTSNSSGVRNQQISRASDNNVNLGRSKMIELEKSLNREKERYKQYYVQYRQLMAQYGTTAANPYLYDNLMEVLNNIINLSEQGKQAARQAGNYSMIENYDKDIEMCKNAKLQLILQH